MARMLASSWPCWHCAHLLSLTHTQMCVLELKEKKEMFLNSTSIDKSKYDLTYFDMNCMQHIQGQHPLVTLSYC